MRRDQTPKWYSASAPSAMLVAAMLGIGFTGEARGQSCETGDLQMVAIDEADFQGFAEEAGAAACVTQQNELTICQITATDQDEIWTVAAQQPEGFSDTQSASELQMLNGQTCLFWGGSPVENTASRWIKIELSVPPDAVPPSANFKAVVQIGPKLSVSVCPVGAGRDGAQCEIWTVR